MSVRANPPHSRRGEPVVIFRLGSHRFLIASDEVEEIRDLRPGNLPSTIATRGNGRQIPVIAADQIFGVPSARLEQVLVLKIRRVAVAIGRIEGMAELREIVALPQAFHGQERSWYRGLGLVRRQIMPVVNAAIFVESARALSTDPVATAERTQANAGT
jgi:chemotaxis signal transduction protein